MFLLPHFLLKVTSNPSPEMKRAIPGGRGTAVISMLFILNAIRLAPPQLFPLVSQDKANRLALIEEKSESVDL